MVVLIILILLWINGVIVVYFVSKLLCVLVKPEGILKTIGKTTTKKITYIINKLNKFIYAKSFVIILF